MTTPYKDSNKTKKEQVATMFNNIAHKYDFLNHALSLGIDTLWRKKAIKAISHLNPQKILDVATGTGDFAITAAKKLLPQEIIGVDISEGMLTKGREKVAKKQLDSIIKMELGDSENLKYESEYFDVSLTGFGVRNFENLQKGLQEIHRVLKPNGVACILEFSKPEKFPIKQLYFFYFKKILPFVGKIFSKDNSAYTYLPDSVEEFPYGQRFAKEAEKAGFKNTKVTSLSFGIANLYVCEK